jgi:hypothetical protein
LKGAYLAQALCAAWNDGAWGLRFDPGPPIWIPPPLALGSGKFDTPWARMHWENFSATLYPPPAVVPEDPEPPHAVTAAAQPKKASASATLCV